MEEYLPGRLCLIGFHFCWPPRRVPSERHSVEVVRFEKWHFMVWVESRHGHTQGLPEACPSQILGQPRAGPVTQGHALPKHRPGSLLTHPRMAWAGERSVHTFPSPPSPPAGRHRPLEHLCPSHGNLGAVPSATLFHSFWWFYFSSVLQCSV